MRLETLIASAREQAIWVIVRTLSGNIVANDNVAPPTGTRSNCPALPNTLTS